MLCVCSEPDGATAVAYSFEEHTGEVRVRLDAERLEDLFVEAGRALGEILGVRHESAEADVERISLSARDHESLLCAWLDELIFQNERSGLIYDEIVIEELGEDHLRATVEGGRMAELRTPVKAATLHGLKIERTRDGFTARVVLDV
jgi:SHS2 domain-containing protein